VPVSIVEGLPSNYKVRGRLCLPAGAPPRTVQVLLHGATYSGLYWDFPYQPQKYSYVRALLADGYATLNIDRLGYGASSHPPSVLVTMQTGAHAVHQVIQAARNGLLGPRFDRVILVGHSVGTVLAWHEAATYHDIHGLIATGNTHAVSPTTAADIFLHWYPALMDSRFAQSGLDPGYLTSRPGSRGIFYEANDADPNVMAVDEATKDTATPTEQITYALELFNGDSSRIKVPVLTAVGRYDRLMCSPDATNCSTAATLLAAEAAFYSPASCLQAYVLPGAGHDINLHLNARDFFAVAARWSDRWIGSSQPPRGDPRRCTGPVGPPSGAAGTETSRPPKPGHQRKHHRHKRHHHKHHRRRH
jgi:pimeloyl-ACP methyl ester carboxylesterase